MNGGMLTTVINKMMGKLKQREENRFADRGDHIIIGIVCLNVIVEISNELIQIIMIVLRAEMPLNVL